MQPLASGVRRGHPKASTLGAAKYGNITMKHSRSNNSGQLGRAILIAVLVALFILFIALAAVGIFGTKEQFARAKDDSAYRRLAHHAAHDGDHRGLHAQEGVDLPKAAPQEPPKFRDVTASATAPPRNRCTGFLLRYFAYRFAPCELQGRFTLRRRG